MGIIVGIISRQQIATLTVFRQKIDRVLSQEMNPKENWEKRVDIERVISGPLKIFQVSVFLSFVLTRKERFESKTEGLGLIVK